jgi:dipeptidyl aminopeptidase/acylaminoacyl peptidase
MTRYSFISLLLLPLAFAGARTFSIDDYPKLTSLQDPQFAPDGRSIAVVVRRPDYTNNVWLTELVQVDVPTKHAQQLTHDLKSVRIPRWSPGGGQIAFLAESGGKAQVFVLKPNGGRPVQITNASSGVIYFAWKPDGSAIAYLTPDEVPTRNKNDDAFEVEYEDYLARSSPPPVHLWIVPAQGGEAKRITSGPWSIAIDLGMPHQWPALAWSPQGDQIAFVSQPTAGKRASYKRTIEIVSADGGNPQPVAHSLDRHCGAPAFSPDGHRILITCPVDWDVKNQSDLVVIPAAGGEWKRITSSIDRNFSRGLWIPSSQAVIVAADDGTRSGLWTIPLDGSARKWNLGEVSIAGLGQGGEGDFDLGPGGRIALVGLEPHRPEELYVMDGPDSAPSRLTDYNSEIAGETLGRVESITWKNDGLPLSGVVTYPPEFDGSKKYPLLVLIHGGPWGTAHETFTAQSQLFASRGWIIFEPNYRGSDSAGNALYAGFYADQGAGSARDVMAELNDLKKRPYVDAGRVGISGWSVGGLMTVWLISHYEGWKAAMAGAAPVDLIDEANLADVLVSTRFCCNMVSQAKDMSLMKEQSGITYVDRIHTPLLILSDTGDERVPVVESYKLFNALRERGRDVKMVLYPVPGHTPGDPYRLRDLDLRWADWFTERLK